MIDRLATLCSKGYFPKELPPVFTTRTFGEQVRSIIKDWAKNGCIPPRFESARERRNGVGQTDAENFSAPKGSHERRVLHITNPAPQAMLAYVVSRNWNLLSKWLRRSRYSFDPVDIVPNGQRAVPEPIWLKHAVHKELIESSANWIVKSDISRFYPSIYTHSISWAAYGKKKVKANLKKYEHRLGDQLDVLIRKCNRNQSVGLPIGPDTSRIIAEIISSHIDEQLFTSLRMSASDADRLNDDWLVGCISYEGAEKCLSSIQKSYLEMGLEINGRKTSIEHLRALSHPPWIVEISSFLNRSDRKSLGGRDLHNMCRIALTAQAKHPGDHVLRYVISTLFNMRIRDSDIPIVEAFLLKAIIVDSRVTDLICVLLLNYIYEQRPVNRSRILRRVIPFVERGLDIGHDYEACWGLYLLRGMKAEIDSAPIRELSAQYEGAVVPLLLLDIERRGNIRKLPKGTWEKRVRKSEFRDWTWLLAYEGVRHGWLRGSALGHPLLKPMNEKGVVFYDERHNVVSRDAFVKRKRRRHTKMRRVLNQFLFGYGT